MEFIGWIISGGVAAIVIQIIDRAVQAAIKKHGKKDTELDALKVGLRVILLDRILYLGRAYIHDGEVDGDDRRRLNAMHDVYHKTLGGNGDADALMLAVNGLPLK